MARIRVGPAGQPSPSRRPRPRGGRCPQAAPSESVPGMQHALRVQVSARHAHSTPVQQLCVCGGVRGRDQEPGSSAPPPSPPVAPSVSSGGPGPQSVRVTAPQRRQPEWAGRAWRQSLADSDAVPPHRAVLWPALWPKPERPVSCPVKHSSPAAISPHTHTRLLGRGPMLLPSRGGTEGHHHLGLDDGVLAAAAHSIEFRGASGSLADTGARR